MKLIATLILSFQLIFTPVIAWAKMDFGSTAKTVVSMASGVVGTKILTICAGGAAQPSILLYFAGSLTYIGKEIVNGFAQGEALDELSTGLESGDEQIGMMKKQLRNEEKNLEIIKRKKIWEAAIVAAYGAAALSALVEGGLAAAAVKPDYAACFPKPDTGPSNALVVTALEKAYTSASLFQTGQGVVSSVKSGDPMAIVSTAVGAKNSIQQVKLLFGLVKGTADLTSTTFGKLLNNGFVRAGTFGAFAAVSTLAIKDLNDQQKAAEKNIQDLNKVVKEMEKLSKDNDTLETDKEKNDREEAERQKKQYALKELPKSKYEKSCWSQQGGTPEFSPKSCSNPIRLTRPTFNSKYSLPTLTAASDAVMDMGQAVANGDMEGANIAAGNLAAMAGKIQDLTDKVEKKINEDLKAKGKPGIDLKKNIAAQVAALEADFNKASGESGTSLAFSSAKLLEEKKEAIPAVHSTEAPVSLPTEEPVFGFSEDSSTSQESLPEVTASLDESLNMYEDSSQDISKKTEISIFKQVSNRYLLNYTKIFETRKSIAPLEASSK